MEHSTKLPSCSLLWCALCRVAFFALGSSDRARERAAASGWEYRAGRHWCDECAKPYRGYAGPSARAASSL